MFLDAFQSIKGEIRWFRNVRDLNVHDIVNMVTKITMITNTNHVQKIIVARNIETARSLGRFGTTSDAHLQEMVFISPEKLGIDNYQVVKNLICKTPRMQEGGGTDSRFTGVDTIMVD